MTSITTTNAQTLVEWDDRQAAAGRVANEVAARSVFVDYRQQKSANTIAAHDRTFRHWATYMAEVTQADERDAETYVTDPNTWHGVTWGLVEGFKRWQLNEGVSIGTLNQRLSIVKTYASMAVKAGVIDSAELHLISSVKGLAGRAARNVDAQREATRQSTKKIEPTELSPLNMEELKKSLRDAGHPQAWRDLVLLCLMADHGLRLSELELLTPSHFNLEAGQFRFYRPKVDKTAQHRLTKDTTKAIREYLRFYPDALKPNGKLLLQTTRRKKDGTGGKLKPAEMRRRSIQRRAERFGKLMAYAEPVSCHDFRHFCATQMARDGHRIDELMNWFSWSSAETAMRYVRLTEVAERRE